MPMECDQFSTWVDAYIDLELEPEQAARLVAHARRCARCGAAIVERQRLRSALIAGMQSHPAPARTVQAIEKSLRGEESRLVVRPVRAPRWAWSALAASLLLAGALAWSVVSPLRGGASRDEIVRDAVSSHIRSLMAGGSHLADIAVSDQHQVKPWFQGKLEFSPRVIDFAADGYPLAGGRLDYIGDRPAAAVIYMRHAHVINLMTCSDSTVSESAPRTVTDRGYHAISWTEPGVRFCAVSDLNTEELGTFVGLVRKGGATK
jgi:anti-sigma factor RsiW